MADFTIKQHDTWPVLEATLTEGAASTPVNLTGATVKLILKVVGLGTTITGTCSIVAPATNGVVQYVWIPADTAAINNYEGEFEVTWSNGKITTFPNDSYFTVEVKADLG